MNSTTDCRPTIQTFRRDDDEEEKEDYEITGRLKMQDLENDGPNRTAEKYRTK